MLSRNPDRARDALRVEAVAWDAEVEPAPVERSDGSRRRGPPGRRAGRPALERAGEAADPRQPGARHAKPRRGAARRRSAAARARVRERRGLLRRPRRRGGRRGRPAGATTSCAGLRRVGGRGAKAEDLGMRVVRLRTGVVLSAKGGALAKMLPPFKAGVGGPVAGGRQWMPWIHARRHRRDVPRRARGRRAGPARSTPPPDARDEPRVLEGARARPAPARRGSRPRAGPTRSLRRDGGDRHVGDAGRSRGARARARLPDLARAPRPRTRRCASALG